MTAPACDTRSGCITCGDEGVAMQVVHVGDDAAVCVDDRGARHEVAVDLIASVAPGDCLLVHAGVAIAPLSQAEHLNAGSVR